MYAPKLTWIACTIVLLLQFYIKYKQAIYLNIISAYHLDSSKAGLNHNNFLDLSNGMYGTTTKIAQLAAKILM